MHSSMSSCTSKETTELLAGVYGHQFTLPLVVLSMCPPEVSQMVGGSEQAVQCMALVKKSLLVHLWILP